MFEIVRSGGKIRGAGLLSVVESWNDERRYNVCRIGATFVRLAT